MGVCSVHWRRRRPQAELKAPRSNAPRLDFAAQKSHLVISMASPADRGGLIRARTDSMASRTLLAAVMALALSGAAHAADDARLQPQLDSLAKGWAHVNYEIKDPHAEAAEAQKLAADAAALARQYPDRAEPAAWQALILLCQADALHNLRGLELARQARRLLEQAARIDPNALGAGTIYANLGALYAQVPSFPIAFGDMNKARNLFDKALAANPSGLDVNYFYGDYLSRMGRRAEAIQALEKALSAPSRSGRELADRGRKWEAEQLLAKLRRKGRGADAAAAANEDAHLKPGHRN